jgi:DNA helicase-2/ATP-dependent DNA helicase PcrA
MNHSLNAEQLEAVMHREGPCIVSACPGSGKTKVVTHRAATMLQEGIDPSSILLITFTNKAAKEMKSRLASLCKNNGIVGAERVMVSTFHALCAQFLRYGAFRVGLSKNYTIIDEDQAMSIMGEIAEEHDISRDDAKLLLWSYSNWRETEDGWLNQWRELSFDSVQCECLKKYDLALASSNAVDFAGLICAVAHGLATDDQARSRISNHYRYLVVDEAQDTNDAQFKIANSIASHNNLMIVGDADQAIYEWRGAKPDNMLKMHRRIEGCRLIILKTNYRSTSVITGHASDLISKNKNRLNDRISPHKTSGSPVSVRVFLRREEEAQDVCKRILAMNKMGVALNRMAVLFRVNSQSRAFEMFLRHYKIPYKITGAFNFMDREEVKDIVSMLKFAVNPQDSISLARFANKPRKEFGPSVISILAPRLSPNGLQESLSRVMSDPAFSNKQKSSIHKVLSAFSGVDASSEAEWAVKKLITDLNYENYLKASVKDKNRYEDKVDNINELIRFAATFSEDKRGNLRDFCTCLSLSETEDESSENSNNVLNLMSIHSAKGLEFNTVFIVCCEDGSIPHSRSIKDGNPSKIDEERRLMYVAMTRAEENLFMSMSILDGRYGSSYQNIKTYSRFLVEAGLMDHDSFVREVKMLEADQT